MTTEEDPVHISSPLDTLMADLAIDRWLDNAAFREGLRKRGWVNRHDTLADAELAPVQRAILDAAIYGVGVLTRSESGDYGNIDPKEYVAFAIPEVEATLKALTSGEWSEAMALKYLYDPIIHAVIHTIIDAGLVPEGKIPKPEGENGG